MNPKLNKGSVRDLIDFDYLDQLNEKEKEFLNKFVEENYIADFRHDKPLYKGKKKRRQIYRENNSRNNDTTSYLWNYQRLESWEDVVQDKDAFKSKSPEDALITAIDMKKKPSAGKT